MYQDNRNGYCSSPSLFNKYDRARDNGKCYLFVQYLNLVIVHGVDSYPVWGS